MSEDFFNDKQKNEKPDVGFDSSEPIISRKRPGPRPDHLNQGRHKDISEQEERRQREYQKMYSYSPQNSSNKGFNETANLAEKSPKSRKTKRRKRRKKLKVVLSVFAAVFLLCIGAFAYLWNSSLFKNSTDSGSAGLDSSIGGTSKDVVNILFIGLDSDVGRETNQLTDTILLASFNQKENKLNVLQIPRDTYIGSGYDKTCKINALYSSGNEEYSGIEGLSKFIYDKIAVPIDHYATVTMEGFRKLIDDIGGVTVDVPYPIDLDGVKLKAGTQTLDGNQAEKFIRQRHGEGYAAGDIDRLKVQRIFMAALTQQILSTGKLKLISALPGVVKEMSTDLTIGGITDLVNKISGLSQDDINFTMVPGESTYVNTEAYGRQSVYSIHKQLLCDIVNSSFRDGLDQIEITDIKLPEIANTSSYFDSVGGSVNDIIDQEDSSQKSSNSKSSSSKSSSSKSSNS